MRSEKNTQWAKYLLRMLAHHKLRVHGALHGTHCAGVESTRRGFRELAHRLDLGGGMAGRTREMVSTEDRSRAGRVAKEQPRTLCCALRTAPAIMAMPLGCPQSAMLLDDARSHRTHADGRLIVVVRRREVRHERATTNRTPPAPSARPAAAPRLR